MSVREPDVEIAGAGIIGLSIAWRLARANLRVRIREARQPGSGASHAAAGMLAPGGEFDHDTPLLHLAQASRAMYPDFIAELSAETGLAIDFAECGAVERPENDNEWNALVTRARRQQEIGIPCDIQDGEIFFPGDAIVNPRDVTAALRHACLARGVEIRENDSVEKVDARGVVTVIAAGCWSSGVRILDGQRVPDPPRVAPVRGHLIGYEMPRASLPHLLRSGPTYLVQRSSGFTIAGSTLEHAGFDTQVDPAVCAAIHQRAARLWPALRDRRPVECWTGLRPQNRDEMPAIGRFGDTRVWLAYGHYRNGILLAPVTARLVADEIIASLGKD